MPKAKARHLFEMNDKTIWEGIKGGDVAALKQLHTKYYHQLLLWITKYTHDHQMSEEVVSNCFEKLWEKRELVIIEKSLKSYLYLMCRNEMISYMRKSERQIVLVTDKLPELPDESEMERQNYYAKLYQTIDKIPEQRRAILKLAVFESLSYKEIAKKLNISVNTVKTQMGRAYHFLKQELDPKTFHLFALFLRKAAI